MAVHFVQSADADLAVDVNFAAYTVVPDFSVQDMANPLLALGLLQ